MLHLNAQLQYKRGEYLYYERKSVVSFTQGAHKRALEESEIGLALAKELKNSGAEITMLNMLAICYQYLGKVEEQLDHVLKAMDIAEATKDSIRLAGLYQSLNTAYSDLGHTQKAINAGLTSIYLKRKVKGASRYLNRTYANVAKDYEVINKPDSALYFYQKGLDLSIETGDSFAEAAILKYLTNFYASQGAYDKMLNMAHKSLKL